MKKEFKIPEEFIRWCELEGYRRIKFVVRGGRFTLDYSVILVDVVYEDTKVIKSFELEQSNEIP